MKCRRCGKLYDGRRLRACPHCGAVRPRPRPAFMKTSTIMISRGSARRVYRSMEEVPAPLRSQLLDSTNGANSATILIADRKGREEIAKAVRSLPGKRPLRRPSGRRRLPSSAVRRAAGVLLAVLAVLSMWAAAGWPWE